MEYRCCYPNCEFTTKHRSKIDHHHIIPREIKKSKHTISLCKNHHALIFHPNATHGQHAINTPESIQILKVYNSTAGETLHYQDFEGKKFFYFLESREIIED